MRGPITLSLSGADVDAENCKGSTACQIALNRGYDELAQFPVEQGCNGLAPFVRLGPLRTLKSTKYQHQTQRRQC